MKKKNLLLVLALSVLLVLIITCCSNQIDPEQCDSNRNGDLVTVFCYKYNLTFQFNVSDGKEGEQGEKGESGEKGIDGENAILEVIDPCGPNESGYDEVIFRLNTGDLMAYFESGSRRFLTLLTPGNYVTTDDQKCNFQITEDMEVLWN